MTESQVIWSPTEQMPLSEPHFVPNPANLILSHSIVNMAEVNQSLSTEAYWQQGYMALAPLFQQQLHEIESDADTRTNTLRARPATIIPSSYGIFCGRSKAEFTEREAMQDLHDFLNIVAKVANTKSDDVSQRIASDVHDIQANFTFLGEREYQEACMGVARAWHDYAAQGEDHIISVFNPVTFDAPTHRKSYNAVLSHILARFEELARPELTSRLKVEPSEWIDSPAAKLVVVDDWITSGATIKNNVSRAAKVADNVGMYTLTSKVEAHLLIARSSQIERMHTTDLGTVPFALRGYYRLEDRGRAPIVSGYHSSVDYWFELPLMAMTDYLRRQGIDREPPLLVELERPYRSSECWSDPRCVAVLGQMAALNGTLAGLRARERELREITRKPHASADLVTELADVVQAIGVNNYKLDAAAQQYELEYRT